MTSESKSSKENILLVLRSTAAKWTSQDLSGQQALQQQLTGTDFGKACSTIHFVGAGTLSSEQYDQISRFLENADDKSIMLTRTAVTTSRVLITPGETKHKSVPDVITEIMSGRIGRIINHTGLIQGDTVVIVIKEILQTAPSSSSPRNPPLTRGLPIKSDVIGLPLGETAPYSDVSPRPPGVYFPLSLST